MKQSGTDVVSAGEKCPDRTTMEGMIWNANRVLEQALRPGVNGVPKYLFENCVGIILLSVVQAGFIFAGNVGTGIALVKNKTTGEWSSPSACGLAGVGWGLLVGGSVKDVIVFVFDSVTMRALAGESGIEMGGQAEFALGPLGRTAAVHVKASERGFGSTMTVAYGKGLFAGLSVEGAVVRPRHAANKAFYDQDASAFGILFDNAVHFPDDKVTLMNEVYAKLEKLQRGETAEPTAQEEQKKEEAVKAVEEATEAFAKQHGDSLVEVDAVKEYEKEANQPKG